ncbi:MAG TPA: CYTH and CHAD domain-containing protein [Streptosporangiaceae bacterium]|nr:CYTH and CHAD domain-containing protein [Streptosporangiaceae bacterium]
MMSTEVETELKYEAPDDAVLPELDQLPAVSATRKAGEEHLEAEYYDTKDWRLIRAGITLRRRTGGHDEGWHLKMPAGVHSRREIRMPLGTADGQVPAQLAELVRAYTRGEPVKQVAVISTRRERLILLGDAGESVAELAMDDVSARRTVGFVATSRWREVEIELTGGNRKMLDAADELLRRSGLRRAANAAKLERVVGVQARPSRQPSDRKLSPSSPAGDVITAYVAGQAERLTRLDPMVRRNEPDAVHQMRITTRRLRSALQTYGTTIWRRDTSGLVAELRWLGRLLGSARDAEVLSERLRSNLADTPVEQVIGPVQARMQGHFAPVGAQARTELVQALDGPRYFALLDQIDALLTDESLADGAGKPARAVLPAAVLRTYRRTSRRMRKANRARAGQPSEAALHRARKAAKRARYASEAVSPAMGRPARRFGKRMRRVQSLLGDYQDSIIARQVDRELAISAALAGENAFTYGVLYERDCRAGELARAQAKAAWRKAAKRRYRRWL